MSILPATRPAPKRRADHWYRPAVTVPLEARLEGSHSEYTDVSLESRSQRGFMHVLRVHLDGQVEHVGALECPAAIYGGRCRHVRDAQLVADAYEAFLALVAQEREWASVPGSYSASVRQHDRQQFERTMAAAKAAGYQLQRPTEVRAL